MPEEVVVSDELTRVAVPGVMLEREAELAALDAVLDAARGGEGRLVVVEGTAGIGKTRLLGAARELALADGLDVLAARGGELEGAFVFGIVRQLFEAPLAAATADARAELFAGDNFVPFLQLILPPHRRTPIRTGLALGATGEGRGAGYQKF
jgi:hypothetical protein